MTSLGYLKQQYWNQSHTFYMNNKEILHHLATNMESKIPYNELTEVNQYDYLIKSEIDEIFAKNFNILHDHSFMLKKSFRDFETTQYQNMHKSRL